MRPIIAVACGMFLALVTVPGVFAQSRERSIIVLVQSDPRGPFNTELLSGFNKVVDLASTTPITIYSEFLDRSRFNTPAYQEQLRQHLEEKYRNRPIGTVVALGAFSLELAAKLQAATWSHIPLIFGQVDESVYRAIPLARNTTGQSVRVELSDMVRVARVAVPRLKKLAIVGDALQDQPVFRHLQNQILSVSKEFQIIDLTGLPMTELQTRVAQLADDTAIIYTAVYSDGQGTYYPPVTALRIIAEKANRPIIGAIGTYVGNGIVGGYVMVPSQIGEAAARLALRVLDGEDPATIPVVEAPAIQPVFDWRELTRWKINEAALPPSSEIRFAPESADGWHYARITAICAAIIVLLGLTAMVGYEHWRRRLAEQATRERISELAHVGRQAIAGELSAAIAHELNQPLGSISNDVEAAELLLNAQPPNIEQLRQLIGDIRRSDRRASDIIRNLRALMSKEAEEFVSADLALIATEAIELAEISAQTSDVTIHLTIRPNGYSVIGSPIQLQQVFLNLLINGIEAVKNSSIGNRNVVVSASEVSDKFVEVSISDSGSGIAPDDLDQIFRPFFTTKENGMGMGLALCQTIVEAHGGSISAANSFSGGAIIRFRLPLKINTVVEERHESWSDSIRS